MPEPVQKPKRRRRVWQAVIGLLLVTLVLWAAWFFTSSAFREYVRGRLEAKISDATGGRAEIKTLQWNLSRMEFEATNITIHGLESADQKPFVHVDRLFARIKIISFFSRTVDLELLELNHPAVHLIFYPDGTTNQPSPKRKSSGQSPAEQLIDLAVGKLQLEDAELILNQQTIPLQFSANDVAFNTTFDHSDSHYDGTLRVGRVEAHAGGWRPLPASTELEFKLFRDHAVIQKLNLISGKSSVNATGEVKDLAHPSIDLKYIARVDIRELAAAARIHDLRMGTVDLDGKATISSQQSHTDGQLNFTDLLFDDGDIRVPGIRGQARYAVSADKMDFTSIRGSLLGGSASGQGEIRNWQDAHHQNAAMSFRVDGVQLREVAISSSTKKLPLTELHFDGETSGDVRLSWNGRFSDSQIQLALGITPPASVPAEQIPVTADLRGTFFLNSQTLQVQSLHLTTPGTRLNAQGTIGSDRAQLKADVQSRRAADFMPLIRAVRGPDATPFEMNGSAAFSGTVWGRFVAPSLAGHLEVTNFTTGNPMQPAGQGKPEASLHWDSLSTEIRYTPEQLTMWRSTIRRSQAQASFDLNARLQKGNFTETSEFTLRLNLRGADVADLQTAAGYNYPVTGRLDAVIQASGTSKGVRGGGHIELNNATIYGEPNCTFSSDIQFNGDEMRAVNFRAANVSGELLGTGSYNRRTTAFSFNAHSGTVQLGKVRLLREKRIDVEGTASLEASGSGTLDAPSINAKLHFRDLSFSGEPAGALDLEAITQGEQMTLRGVSDFQNASLQLTGDVRLRDRLPAHLVLTFNNLDVDPLVRGYLRQFRTTSHTLMAGRVEINGPLRDWRRLEMTGSIDSFVAGVENIKVASSGPIKFSMKDEVLHLDALHLIGEGTDFSATGTANLAGDRALNMRGEGRVNMRILQSFSPEYTSSGLTTINVNLRGTVDQPRMRGRIMITNGAISYVDLPNGLSQINGTMIFTEDRLQVQKLTAHTGGGDLELGGFISYSNGITFNLTAKGTDIRLRYPPGVSASGDASLTLAGTPRNSLLSGDVTVTRFGLNPKFDFASYLAKSKQPQLPVRPDSPMNSLRLDVHVVSTPELQLETSLAKVTGSIDLHLRGTAARPVLLGRLNIFEGDIVFNSTTYHLERGEISFNNPAQIQPVLDVEASAHVRDYDITLGFHGPADRPSISYRSDPPLPTADIIALLALGRTRQESATAQMYNPQQTTLSESDENALLGQALNATVSSRVQRLFGVSRIKIDPQVGGAENNANARLTIEQQVSNKITITYITNLSQSAQQIIQVEWNITRDLSLQGIRDQTGVLGFDVRIRQRKK